MMLDYDKARIRLKRLEDSLRDDEGVTDEEANAYAADAVALVGEVFIDMAESLDAIARGE